MLRTIPIKPKSGRYKPKTRIIGFRRTVRKLKSKKIVLSKPFKLMIRRDAFGQWAGSKSIKK